MSIDDGLHQPQLNQEKPISSFKLLKPPVVLISIFLIALMMGAIGIIIHQNTLFSDERASLQPLPTIMIQSSMPTLSPSSQHATAYPSSNMKIYRNERLGFEFRYPEFYEVMEEATNRVTFGSGGIPYITISTNQITDYKSYRLCEDIDEANMNWQKDFPCLYSGWEKEGEIIIETTLGGISAISFYIAEYVPDGDYRIMQTTDSPKIEVKMYISRAGLDWNFEQMLSTFKFLGQTHVK
jgi:hypothetical protein